MIIPYASATSGDKARGEVTKILRQFGCSNVGFMDDFDKHTVLLAFEHKGQRVQLKASAQGWAALYLKQHPWTHKRRTNRAKYELAALDQGLVAINSILRDWVKGQVTAVECGVMSFAAVFMPHMLTEDGTPLIERIVAEKLLPSPKTDRKDV